MCTSFHTSSRLSCRCLIIQPWFIQPNNLNKIMCFPDQPLGPLTFIKHSPGTHLPHPSLWRMPRTQRHFLFAALAGKIQNFQEILNLVKSRPAPRLFFTCLFQDSAVWILKAAATWGVRKVWFVSYITPLSANPSTSNYSVWAPVTGDSFLPREGADYAVFFPLWHKEEYFTRTWAPTRSPCKNKVSSFSPRFPSRQTQRHTALTCCCHKGTFSSCFKQMLQLWLDFPLVLRQSTSVGVKQVIGTSPGPVWWSRATCQ